MSSSVRRSSFASDSSREHHEFPTYIPQQFKQLQSYQQQQQQAIQEHKDRNNESHNNINGHSSFMGRKISSSQDVVIVKASKDRKYAIPLVPKPSKMVPAQINHENQEQVQILRENKPKITVEKKKKDDSRLESDKNQYQTGITSTKNKLAQQVKTTQMAKPTAVPGSKPSADESDLFFRPQEFTQKRGNPQNSVHLSRQNPSGSNKSQGIKVRDKSSDRNSSSFHQAQQRPIINNFVNTTKINNNSFADSSMLPEQTKQFQVLAQANLAQNQTQKYSNSNHTSHNALKKKTKRKNLSLQGLNQPPRASVSEQNKTQAFLEGDNSNVGFRMRDYQDDHNGQYLHNEDHYQDQDSQFAGLRERDRVNFGLQNNYEQFGGNILHTEDTATFEATGQTEEKRQNSFSKKVKVNKQPNGQRSSSAGKKGHKRGNSNGQSLTGKHHVNSSGTMNPNSQIKHSNNVSSSNNNNINVSQVIKGDSISASQIARKRILSETKPIISQMVLDNLRKKKMEELILKQQEEMEEKIRQEKKLQQQVENEQIRLNNAQRFLKQKVKEPSIFPWGFNQQKIRQFMADQQRRDERSLERIQANQIHHMKCDDTYRRQQLGLQFLNYYDQETILQLKKNPEHEIDPQLQPSSCKSKSLEKQHIQLFIEQKKQQQEELKRDEQHIREVHKLKIEANLKRLSDTIKRQQQQHLQQQQQLYQQQQQGFDASSRTVRSKSFQKKFTAENNSGLQGLKKLRSASNDGVNYPNGFVLGAQQGFVHGNTTDIDIKALENVSESDRKFSILSSQCKKMIAQALQDQLLIKQNNTNNNITNPCAYSLEQLDLNQADNPDLIPRFAFSPYYSSTNKNANTKNGFNTANSDQNNQLPLKTSSGKTSLHSFITRNSKDLSNTKNLQDTNQTITSIELKKQRIFEQFVQLGPKLQQLCSTNAQLNKQMLLNNNLLNNNNNNNSKGQYEPYQFIANAGGAAVDQEEEGDVSPDVPSENDFVDEHLVRDEFRSSSSSSSSLSKDEVEIISKKDISKGQLIPSAGKVKAQDLGQQVVVVSQSGSKSYPKTNFDQEQSQQIKNTDNQRDNQDVNQGSPICDFDLPQEQSKRLSRSGDGGQSSIDSNDDISRYQQQSVSSAKSPANQLDQRNGFLLQQSSQSFQDIKESSRNDAKQLSSKKGLANNQNSKRDEEEEAVVEEEEEDEEERNNLLEIRSIEQRAYFKAAAAANGENAGNSNNYTQKNIQGEEKVFKAQQGQQQQQQQQQRQRQQHEQQQEDIIANIQDTAATLIQKVWKGYSTRRILGFHLAVLGEQEQLELADEQEEDDQLKEQIIEYLIESGQECTEEEFNEYFLKFKQDRMNYKKQQQQLLLSEEAAVSAANKRNTYQKQQQNHQEQGSSSKKDNNFQSPGSVQEHSHHLDQVGSKNGRGIVHSNSSVHLHSQQHSSNQKEYKSNRSGNHSHYRNSNNNNRSNQLESEERDESQIQDDSNRQTEEVLNTDDLLMDEEQYIQSAQRYQFMKEHHPQMLTNPVHIDYDNLFNQRQSQSQQQEESQNKYNNSSQTDRHLSHSRSLNRLLESADRNHFGNNNNHKLSGFDEGKGEFYHEVEEYDGEFYESQNSESQRNRNSNNGGDMRKKFMIEDEKGELIEIDLSNLPGIEQPHFRESDLIFKGGKEHWNTEESVENNNNNIVLDKEKEFNQVRNVSTKRKVKNLGIKINDDEDEDDQGKEQYEDFQLPGKTSSKDSKKGQGAAQGVQAGNAVTEEFLNNQKNNSFNQNLHDHRLKNQGIASGDMIQIKDEFFAVGDQSQQQEEENLNQDDKLDSAHEESQGTQIQSVQKSNDYQKYIENLEFAGREQQRDQEQDQGLEEEDQEAAEELDNNIDISNQNDQSSRKKEELSQQKQEKYPKQNEQTGQAKEQQQQQLQQYQQQKGSPNAHPEEDEDDDDEDDVEEYEIDLEYLLTKSQYEDSQGNVFIYENGEQIFLGEEELAQIDEYTLYKERQIAERQAIQTTQNQSDLLLELIHQKGKQTPFEERQHQEKEEAHKNQSINQVEQKQNNAQQEREEENQIEISNMKKNNQEQMASQQAHDGQGDEEGEREEEVYADQASEEIEGDADDKNTHSLMPKELSKEKNTNNGINEVISRAQEITESLEKTKQDQAKQWADLMEMLGTYDANKLDASAQDIIEQVKAKSQQNLKQLMLSQEQLSDSSKDKSEKLGDNEQQCQKQQQLIKKPSSSAGSLQISKNICQDSPSATAIGQRRQLLIRDQKTTMPAIILSGRSHNTPTHRFSETEGDEEGSSTGGSVFEAAPFEEFTQKKFKQFYSHEICIGGGERTNNNIIEEGLKPSSDNRSDDNSNIDSDRNSSSRQHNKKREINSKQYDIHMVAAAATTAKEDKLYPPEQQQQSLLSPRLGIAAGSAGANSLKDETKSNLSDSSVVRTQRDMIFLAKMKSQESSDSIAALRGQISPSQQSLSNSSVAFYQDPQVIAAGSIPVTRKNELDSLIVVMQTYQANNKDANKLSYSSPKGYNSEIHTQKQQEQESSSHARSTPNIIQQQQQLNNVSSSLQSSQLAVSGFKSEYFEDLLQETPQGEFERSYEEGSYRSGDQKEASQLLSKSGDIASQLHQFQSIEQDNKHNLSKKDTITDRKLGNGSIDMPRLEQQQQSGGIDRKRETSKQLQQDILMRGNLDLIERIDSEIQPYLLSNSSNHAHQQIHDGNNANLIESQSKLSQPQQHSQQQQSQSNYSSIQQAQVQILCGNYHNNYSLDNAEDSVESLTIAEQIHASNLIHAAGATRFQNSASASVSAAKLSAKSSADKLSDLNYSKDIEDDNDVQYQAAAAYQSAAKSSNHNLLLLQQNQKLEQPLNYVHPHSSPEVPLENDLLVAQTAEMPMIQGKDVAAANFSGKYDSEVFEESNFSESEREVLQLSSLFKSNHNNQHSNNSGQTLSVSATAVTEKMNSENDKPQLHQQIQQFDASEETISEEDESLGNEPVTMVHYGEALPKPDALQDQIPLLHPPISPPNQRLVENQKKHDIEDQLLLQKDNETELISETIFEEIVNQFAEEIASNTNLLENLFSKETEQLRSTQDEIENKLNRDKKDQQSLSANSGGGQYISQQQYEGEEGEEEDEAIIRQELEIERRRIIEAKKLPGICTNFTAVTDYLNALSEYIMEHYVDQFVTGINISLGPSPVEMLKYLHFSDATSVDSNELENSSDLTLQHSAVLTTDLYSAFEMLKLQLNQHTILAKFHQDYSMPVISEQWKATLKDITHIHNKVIFDAFNEALDSNRIYGLKGKPFPWKVDSTKISCAPITTQKVPGILQKAKQQVLEWSKSQCGIFFDHQQSILNEQTMQNAKEKRLTAMLNKEVKEAEDKWILYDDEYTEIQMEISECIYDELITQAAYEISLLRLPFNTAEI